MRRRAWVSNWCLPPTAVPCWTIRGAIPRFRVRFHDLPPRCSGSRLRHTGSAVRRRDRRGGQARRARRARAGGARTRRSFVGRGRRRPPQAEDTRAAARRRPAGPQLRRCAGVRPTPARLPRGATFPAVLKPVSLSGSRGVMRVDERRELTGAVERSARATRASRHPAERDPAHELLLLESFIEGHEFAVEGLMTRGRLQTLAIFDKPDPLDGPFFEETIYLTLAGHRLADLARRIERGRGRGGHGDRALARPDPRGVSRQRLRRLRARSRGASDRRHLRPRASIRAHGRTKHASPLEELLLRHALGRSRCDDWRTGGAAPRA